MDSFTIEKLIEQDTILISSAETRQVYSWLLQECPLNRYRSSMDRRESALHSRGVGMGSLRRLNPPGKGC